MTAVITRSGFRVTKQFKQSQQVSSAYSLGFVRDWIAHYFGPWRLGAMEISIWDISFRSKSIHLMVLGFERLYKWFMSRWNPLGKSRCCIHFAALSFNHCLGLSHLPHIVWQWESRREYKPFQIPSLSRRYLELHGSSTPTLGTP
jgi:hypothetical protein